MDEPFLAFFTWRFLSVCRENDRDILLETVLPSRHPAIPPSRANVNAKDFVSRIALDMRDRRLKISGLWNVDSYRLLFIANP